MAGFTDRYIESLQIPSAGKRTEVTDPACRGLVIRVTDKGAKSWAFVYKRVGKLHKVTLGSFPKPLGLSDARALARKCQDDLHAGRSPVDERAAEKMASETAFTFEALCRHYIENYAKPNKRSWREDERLLKRPIAVWGGRPAAHLSRNEILSELERIGASAPTVSRRTFAVLHRMFRLAVGRTVSANPIVGAVKFGKDKPRKVHLDDAGIRKFLRGLDTDGCPVSIPVARALRLVLLTGQRPLQISGLRRDELSRLDIPKPKVTFPPERMKGEDGKVEEHVLPLGRWAIEIIKASLADQDPDNPSKYVFPARRDPKSNSGKVRGDVPITRAALSHALGKFCKHFGMADFRPHDLRRTAATIASGQKIPSEHIERLLAHKLPGVSGIYNKNPYFSEKLAAVQAIEVRLRRLMEGPTPRGRAKP